MPVYHFNGYAYRKTRSWGYPVSSYQVARDGTGYLQSDNLGSYSYWGQDNPLGGGDYYLRQTFLSFDTSTIPDGEEVIRVSLAMPQYLDWSYQGHPVLCEDPDEETEVRFWSWSGDQEYAPMSSWVAGDAFAALPILAHRPYLVDGQWTYQAASPACNNLITGPDACEHINKTGWTQTVVCTSKFAANVAPAGYETYSCQDGAPWRLCVVTRPAAPNTSQVMFQPPSSNVWSAPNTLAGQAPAAAQVGDLLIGLAASYYITGDWSVAPAGWNLLTYVAPTNHQTPAAVYWKIAEPVDIFSGVRPFSTLNTYPMGCTMFAVTNFRGSAPLGDYDSTYHHAISSNTGGCEIPSLTQNLLEGVLVAVFVRYSYNAATFSGYTCETNNPTWTEVYDYNSNGTRPNVGIAFAERNVISNTGLITCTEDTVAYGVDYTAIGFFINGYFVASPGKFGFSVDLNEAGLCVSAGDTSLGGVMFGAANDDGGVSINGYDAGGSP